MGRPSRQRIEIDVPFAAIPQELLMDMSIKPAAMRLWGVLYAFRWRGLAPDFAALAVAMDTTERSVYRWLQELEAAGWLTWDRNADLEERFTLRTTIRAQELTPASIPETTDADELTPGSEKLIVRSIKLTPVSISEGTDGTPEPQIAPTHKIQNHVYDGDGESRAEESDTGGLEHALVKRDFSLTVAREVAQMGLDPPTVIAFVDAMLTSGRSHGHIVNRLRRAPPQPGEHYAPAEHPLDPDRHHRPAARSPDRVDRHAPASIAPPRSVDPDAW